MVTKDLKPLPNHTHVRTRIIKVLVEFTRSSPMGSITTGMLNLLVKPSCSTHEFSMILDGMQHDGLLIGTPKGKTKRWRLDQLAEP